MSTLYESYQYKVRNLICRAWALEGLKDQFRESHTIVGGEVVAFQEAEAGLHPGYRAD